MSVPGEAVSTGSPTEFDRASPTNPSLAELNPGRAAGVLFELALPMTVRGPSRQFAAPLNLVASLIGRFGSSAFRLSTSAVSMSLAGSCFSSDSAPGPFHYGIRGRGGTIYWTALPSERQVQATKRTHLIHRPARDIIPPRGGARVFSYRM